MSYISYTIIKLIGGHMKKIDLTGKRFGYLIVIKEHGHKYGHISWLCKCDCGKEKITISSSLKNGKTRSCGSCINSEKAIKGLKEIQTTCVWCKKSFVSKGFYNVKKTCSKECERLYNLNQIHNRSRKDFKHILMQSLNRVSSKSLKKSKPCDLTLEFLEQKLKDQNYKCCKTEMAFEISQGKGINNRSPWSLSIDQKEPNKGYTQDNIQLVCLMYNLCKGVWSDNEVKQFVKAVRDYE
jgi:hypothetical protein